MAVPEFKALVPMLPDLDTRLKAEAQIQRTISAEELRIAVAGTFLEQHLPTWVAGRNEINATCNLQARRAHIASLWTSEQVEVDFQGNLDNEHMVLRLLAFSDTLPNIFTLDYFLSTNQKRIATGNDAAREYMEVMQRIFVPDPHVLPTPQPNQP